MIYGLVAPGYEMAEVLAANLTGGAADLHRRRHVDEAQADGRRRGELRRHVGRQPARPSRSRSKIPSAASTRSSGSAPTASGCSAGSSSAMPRITARCWASTRATGRCRLRPATWSAAEAPARRGVKATDLSDNVQICSCNNVSKGQICCSIRDGQARHGRPGQVGHQGRHRLRRMPAAGHRAFARRTEGRRPQGEQPSLRAFRLHAAGAVPDRQDQADPHLRRACWKATAGGRDAKFANRPWPPSWPVSGTKTFSTTPRLQDTNDRFLANIQRRRYLLGRPADARRRDHAGKADHDRPDRQEIRPVYQDHRRPAGRYARRAGPPVARYLGRTGRRRLRERPRLRQGPADGEKLRGHDLVPLCGGRLGRVCRPRSRLRYRGIRAPHKLKSAVSGCVRECAEAQSKDFGLIATEKGWNLYVCGNGGAQPRHADLLAADLDEDTCIRYIDRFLMYYIQTADRLTRTSKWLEAMEGGIDYLRDVIVNDRLQIADELERQAQFLVESYRCEWREVVKDPEKRRMFRQFVNTDETRAGRRVRRRAGPKAPGGLAVGLCSPPGPQRPASASPDGGRASGGGLGLPTSRRRASAARDPLASRRPRERFPQGCRGLREMRGDPDRRLPLRQPQ